MKRSKRITIAIALLTFIPLIVHAEEKQSFKPLIVVELFTSQGCHSCPSADRYLGKLAQDEHIITLACHVTYWNYLGWKDTFSLPFCDYRQQAYRKYFDNRSSYTPQMVINGRYEGVGSQRNRIHSMLEKTKMDVPLHIISMTKIGDVVQLDLSKVEAKAGIELYLLGVASTQEQHIANGENGGKTLNYHNPVLIDINLGERLKQGNQASQIVDDSNENVKTWIALAQDVHTGHIVAAGKY